MTTLTPFPRRPASMPVDRLPLGARVTVDLAPQLGLILPGVIVNVTYKPGDFRYQIDLGLDGIHMFNVPAERIKLDEGSAA